MQSFRLILAALLTMGVSASTNTTTMTMTTTIVEDDQNSVSSGCMAAPSIVAVVAWYGWQAFTTCLSVGGVSEIMPEWDFDCLFCVLLLVSNFQK